MSTSTRAPLIEAFFVRLATAAEVIRAAMGYARLSARLVFRGDPERAVLLDLRPDPLTVQTGASVEPGQIEVCIDADVMHEVLLGDMPPGVALARRELLLRGSAAHLARFIPLFDLAPALYAAHVEANMNDGSNTAGQQPATRKPPMVQRLIAGLSYGFGWTLGWMRRRLMPRLDLFEVLAALSRGLKAGGGK